MLSKPASTFPSSPLLWLQPPRSVHSRISHTYTHTHGSLVTVFPFGEKHGRLAASFVSCTGGRGGKGATLSAPNVFSKNCFDEETFAAVVQGEINKQDETKRGEGTMKRENVFGKT